MCPVDTTVCRVDTTMSGGYNNVSGRYNSMSGRYNNNLFLTGGFLFNTNKTTRVVCDDEFCLKVREICKAFVDCVYKYYRMDCVSKLTDILHVVL